MKKLLLLGGLRYLIPVINAAKDLGHYVITCDYLPDNIAHIYSDEYHNISIVDKEAVLDLAKRLKIDGIMSFAVDPGVVTAAYVADKMGLPTPGPVRSVEILQNKALFRQFLKEHNFNVPWAKSFRDMDKALLHAKKYEFPVMVKPVDAAGSKGVSKVARWEELGEAIKYALKFSNTKEFIMEEFLESKGFSSDCDCFSIDGNLSFVSYSGQRFDRNSPNPYTPSAFSWPASISKDNQSYLTNELQRLITLLGMKSSLYNVEVRETVNSKAYIMEVSPRGGGNRLAEMVRSMTGVDLIKRAVQAALGSRIDPIRQVMFNEFWAEVILYSNKDGQFERLVIDEKQEYLVKEIDLWVKPGDKINGFSAANDSVGTLILKFGDREQMNYILEDYSKFFKVKVI
ncbi:MAG TPA: ATP-grasp domain-containing protein [Edaphocola sp.]|nr:ATP-grasp domain-containing protein [Edaphocola sp.]